jgi:hypothetical protein
MGIFFQTCFKDGDMPTYLFYSPHVMARRIQFGGVVGLYYDSETPRKMHITTHTSTSTNDPSKISSSLIEGLSFVGTSDEKDKEAGWIGGYDAKELFAGFIAFAKDITNVKVPDKIGFSTIAAFSPVALFKQTAEYLEETQNLKSFINDIIQMGQEQPQIYIPSADELRLKK